MLQELKYGQKRSKIENLAFSASLAQKFDFFFGKPPSFSVPFMLQLILAHFQSILMEN